jgi:hypothetical protein
VTEAIREFLRGQWRYGALLGRTEDKAFYVRWGRTTMTQDEDRLELGLLRMDEIGVAVAVVAHSDASLRLDALECSVQVAVNVPTLSDIRHGKCC